MDFSRLKTNSVEAIVFGISPVFSMGVLFYIKNPQLFLTMDIFKLIILCIGFSIPLYVLNFITLENFAVPKEGKKDLNLILALKAHTGTFTSFQISFVSILCFFIDMNMKTIIFILLSIWLVFRMIAIIDRDRAIINSKHSDNPND
ncbi:MAG: hypothetical protein GXC72_00765 [Chitinophagaceae bacterium]|nr:hypothetical protein [Chitinophagaceae bacterium]